MKCIVRVSSRRRERTYNDGTRNEILGVINLMYRSSRDVICFEMWHRLDISQVAEETIREIERARSTMDGGGEGGRREGERENRSRATVNNTTG